MRRYDQIVSTSVYVEGGSGTDGPQALAFTVSRPGLTYPLCQFSNMRGAPKARIIAAFSSSDTWNSILLRPR